MNQRNVEALASLLQEAGIRHGLDKGYSDLAEWLASRGVLVPSALTDDELDRLPGLDSEYYGESVYMATEAPHIRKACRSALERIARGEQP